MTRSQVEQAARNNAIWCDTLCRAHGAPGEFHDALWVNRHPAPRFYPNAVTLSDQQDAATQLAHIRALIDSGLPGDWGVKDSFGTLDLSAWGFQLLFEASWLWRATSSVAGHHTPSGIRWTRVQSAPELADWEAAWGGNPEPGSPALPRLFLPPLLADQDVAFIAAYHGKTIVAGAIANRTGGVVGLSNAFARPEYNHVSWSECIAAVQERFPGLPFVGYERGADLAVAQAAGFETLHGLRVWTRQV